MACFTDELGRNTLGAVEVIVAVLDGCQGVVDDRFVEILLVAALGPRCAEAVAELGASVSGVRCGEGSDE